MKYYRHASTLGLLRLAAAVAVVAVLDAGAAGDFAPTQPVKSPDPHWQADGCRHCHQMKNGQALAIPPRKVTQICLECHNGRNAPAEGHPIGRILAGPEFTKPKGKGWPLIDNRLVCLTCHDVKQGCSQMGRHRKTRAFLRGGPVRNIQVFCQNCHKPQRSKMYNPHLMLKPDKTYRVDACRFCHLPKTKNKRLDLCRSCHPRHVDWFQPGHIAAKMSAEMQAYAAAREHTGPTTRPSRQLIAEMKSAGARPTWTRPDPDGKVVCTTCHNPHLEGLFAADHKMAHGTMKLAAPDKVVSPVRTWRLCIRCHNK